MSREIEDGMGFAGFAETRAEREQDKRDQADRKRLRIYHEALQQIATSDGDGAVYTAKKALADAKALRQPVYGLNCGVDLKTGKGVCVCGRCSPTAKGVAK